MQEYRRKAYRIMPAMKSHVQILAGFNSGLVAEEVIECMAGESMQGRKRPHDCPYFEVFRTPEPAR